MQTGKGLKPSGLPQQMWEFIRDTGRQRLLQHETNWALEDAKNYEEKLAAATTPDDRLKFLLLISLAAFEKYVAQTRLQADASFRLCKRISNFSWILIAVGILGSMSSTILETKLGIKALDPAKVSALAGVLTQVIAAIFFYLYNRTLQQFNLFGDKLSEAQRIALALAVGNGIANADKKDAAAADLIKALLSPKPSSPSGTPPTPTPAPGSPP